jgi:membrane protein
VREGRGARVAGAIATARELLAGVARRYREEDLSDRAAAQTYWGFLSLFPALIVAVALLGLFGDYPETYRSVVSTLREAAPGEAVDALDGALEDAVRSRQTAGGLLGVGLVLSLYSASSGIGAILRSIQAIYGTTGRSFVRGHLERLALTLEAMALFALAFLAIVVAGPVFSLIASEAGIDESVSRAVSLLRWPVGVAALTGIALLLYRAGSNRERRARGLLPGACAASVLWLVASAGFSLYVAGFGAYDATYGSLGAVIVLLIYNAVTRRRRPVGY